MTSKAMIGFAVVLALAAALLSTKVRAHDPVGGLIVGGAIGAAVGGPPGAAVGAVLGTIIGSEAHHHRRYRDDRHAYRRYDDRGYGHRGSYSYDDRRYDDRRYEDRRYGYRDRPRAHSRDGEPAYYEPRYAERREYREPRYVERHYDGPYYRYR